MNKRRIFIAVNLPSFIKKKIAGAEEKVADKNIRWVKSDNLHITLVFVGYVSDQELAELCRVAREIAQKHESFEIKLNKICLGPFGKTPRMVWLCGEKSPELAALKNDLEEGLLNASTGLRHKEFRPFSPHITLSRLRQSADLPDIPFGTAFPVDSVEIMESELKKSGAEYSMVESIPLH